MSLLAVPDELLLSINEFPHTLESISSVTKEEPLYITTVSSVPAAIFGILIVRNIN